MTAQEARDLIPDVIDFKNKVDGYLKDIYSELEIVAKNGYSYFDWELPIELKNEEQKLSNSSFSSDRERLAKTTAAHIIIKLKENGYKIESQTGSGGGRRKINISF